MRIAVTTAVYDFYETPKQPPEQTIPAEWIMVTDCIHHAPGWKVVWEPRPWLHPNVAAKVPKFRPDLYTDADVTIWIDASAILGPRFIEMCMEALSEADIIMFAHPDRDSIEAEADFSSQLPKYAGLPMIEQAAYYRSLRPELKGLWAGGCIARWTEVLATDDTYFGHCMLSEIARWGYQDQIALPYVLDESLLRAAAFPYHLRQCPHLTWGPHAKAGM